MSNFRTELCHICDEKFKLENEKSVENHNLLHKEELAGIRMSNNMKDAVKTICNICKSQQNVSRMREHTKRAHNVHITEYKLRYNIANDRNYDVVERVFHRCGICFHCLPLCSDLIAGHIRKHGITHANYNAKYMVIRNTDPARSHKNDPARSHKRKSKESEPLIAPDNEAIKTIPPEESTKKRFPSGLQVTVTKVSENQEVTEKRQIGQVVEDKIDNNKPVKVKAEKESVENLDKKISKSMSPTKDAVNSELSYAEQISMFLRRKEIEIKDKKASSQPKQTEEAQVIGNQKKDDDIPNQTNSQNPPLNNLPSVDSLIGILEKQNSAPSETQPLSTPSLPSIKPVIVPELAVSTSSNNIPLTPQTLPNPSDQASLLPTPVIPKFLNSVPITSARNNSGLIRILSPEAINNRHDNSKTTSVPIQTSLPLNIIGQHAIKKVKLANGRILHLFLKNTKANDPQIKPSKQEETKRPESVLERASSPQHVAVNRDSMEEVDNIPEDPLMVDTDTPAFEDPVRMNIDPLFGEPTIINNDYEMRDSSESTNSLETEQNSKENNPFEKGHGTTYSTIVLKDPKATPLKKQIPSASVPLSNPDNDVKKNPSPQKSLLDDSGFSDIDITDISSSPSFDSESSNIEKAPVDIDTEDLISRLASKTKQILAVPTAKSPPKDASETESESADPLNQIENSKEFSEMMKRISDNLAQLNGNKIAQSTSSSTPRKSVKDCMDSLVEAAEGVNDILNEVSEDELDLVVEDIWSESS